MRWRVAGLIANFIANAVLLHGAVRYFDGVAGPAQMYAGLAITIGCVIVLSAPTRVPGGEL
ncbi:MAG: hypothetical protein ACRD26_12745 [Vicinamibacterales bacterium]